MSKIEFVDKFNDTCSQLSLELEPYIDRIKQCEEFSECDEIVIMKFPVTIDEEKNKIENKTYKLVPKQKFKGKCYLLSLALTPEMFDPKKIH